MLGTIEELEKEIEQFQNNMAASGEMTKLLQKMLKQIQNQNTAFESESEALLTQLKLLPDTVKQANNSSNEEIRKNIAAELQKALDSFSKEQDRYIALLEQVKQQIQGQSEQAETCIKQIGESADRIVARTEAIPEQIKRDNQGMQQSLVADVDRALESRNAQFAEKQSRYIEAMQTANSKMESCQSELILKYQEFLRTLENTNLTYLHEENQQLKNELNKRTTILMVISALSVVIGIVGLFL